MNAKKDILIFLIGRAFTKNAVKEASIFLPALHIFSVAYSGNADNFPIARRLSFGRCMPAWAA
ncbi:MAG: hypothetical protein DMF44_15515 [Verrucomicrobia bacterium]|nr:MAG: hypothetical protein DMF44_15515 [Verrucomicrobiota bacterium]